MSAGSPLPQAEPILTLINTAYRQSYAPAPGVKRKPFSLEALYNIDGFKAFTSQQARELPDDPLSIDLGVAEVRRLQLEPVMPRTPSHSTMPNYDGQVTFST